MSGRWGAQQWSALAGVVAALSGVIALVIDGCGDDGPDKNESAIVKPKTASPAQQRRQIAQRGMEAFFEGDWGAVWDQLHPADQTVVTRDRYEECQASTGSTATLRSIKYVGPSAFPIDRPGLPGTSATQVVFDITVAVPEGDTTVRRGQAVAKYEGKWRLLMPEPEYEAFADGRCPKGEGAYVDPPELEPPERQPHPPLE